MFPRDLAAAGATDGLSVDLGVDVVLAGLPPVYAHGLHAGLTATGLRCTVARAATAGELSGEPGRALVVVQPSGADPATDGLPRAPVLVLADGSAQAYSDALQAGATGAFPSDAELGDIVRVLLCAGLGLTLLPVDVARALSRRSTGPGPQLTSLELQYLRLLARGATVASRQPAVRPLRAGHVPPAVRRLPAPGRPQPHRCPAARPALRPAGRGGVTSLVVQGPDGASGPAQGASSSSFMAR